MWQGSLESNYNYGTMLTEIMNEAEFDAFTIGNHEFDWGVEKIIANRQLKDKDTNYQTPFLAGNIYNYNINSATVYDHASDLGDKYVIRELENGLKVGIIGVIGGYYIGKFSTDWYSSRITRGEIIQGYYKKNLYQKKHFNVNKYNYGPYVAAIDGLWMCIPKNLFTNHKIQWDSNTFHGFHLYDLDICMQVNSLGYKIQIADDILIEHQSSGNPNKTFYDNCVLFHKKWNRILPFTSTLQINSEDIEKYELTILSNLCTFMHLYKEQQRILNQPLHKLVSKITSFVNKWRK